jgi:hypothetical protein
MSLSQNPNLNQIPNLELILRVQLREEDQLKKRMKNPAAKAKEASKSPVKPKANKKADNEERKKYKKLKFFQ